jgi:hypothetical protein
MIRAIAVLLCGLPLLAHAEEKDCGQLDQGDYILVVDVAATGQAKAEPLGRDHTYPSVPIRVCLENLDYRMRYRVTSTYTDLPPLESPDLASLFPARTTARTTAQATETKSAEKVILDAIASIQGALKELTGGSAVPRDKAEGIDAQLAAAIAILRSTEPPDDDLLHEASAWSRVAKGAHDHIARVSHNVFSIRPLKNKKVDVAVLGEPLTLDATTPALSYGEAKELARGSFEIRGLSYVRYGLGLLYTNLRNESFGRGRNDLGADVIRHTEDNGIVPALFVTHYWCGADERELQPWDRSRGTRCWAVNTFIPTLTLGLPLSINPLEHLFVGLMWQPAPAVAFVAGLHLGKVTVLRKSFVDGAGAPPASSGFRDGDATERDLRLGYFLGVSITDAVFTKIVRNSLAN